MTWNSRDLVPSSLASLPPDVDVFVVDNASEDGTADYVEGSHPDVRLIRNESNRGFAAAVNQAAAESSSEYLLLLNPDAELCSGALASLVSFADSRPSIGAVSALVVDRGGEPEMFSGGRQPSLLSVAVHELGLSRALGGLSLYGVASRSEPHMLGWVAGTCLLLRKSAFVLVGGLDERYFLYCEDMDLCRRLLEAGYETWLFPSARAIHRRSTAVNRAGPWVDDYRLGSLDRYYASRTRRAPMAAFRTVRLAGASLRAGAFWVGGFVMRNPTMRARGIARARDAALLARLLVRGR